LRTLKSVIDQRDVGLARAGAEGEFAERGIKPDVVRRALKDQFEKLRQRETSIASSVSMSISG
jgi:hypothetical protein